MFKFVKIIVILHKKVILVSMPIRQNKNEYKRALKHINTLEKDYKNVTSYDIDLSNAFLEIEKVMPFDISKNCVSPKPKGRSTLLSFKPVINKYKLKNPKTLEKNRHGGGPCAKRF